MVPHINGDDYKEEQEETTLESVLLSMIESMESIDAKLDVIMSHFRVKAK